MPDSSTYKGKFDASQIRALIDQLEDRYRDLHKKIGKRIQHFHNDPAVDPVLPVPFDQGPKWQSDLPRRTHQELRSRLTENHCTVSVKPLKENASNRKPANALEEYFNEGIQLLEERMGNTLQEALADGQIIYCYGVLHWRKSEHVWPDVPELKFLEADEGVEAPDGYEAFYRDDDEPEDAMSAIEHRLDENLSPVYVDGMPQKRKLRGYRESQTTNTARYQQSYAEAGFAWMVETPIADAVMFVNDRSLLPQPAICIVRRTVGILDYQGALDKEQKPTASLNEIDKDIPVYGETNAPVSPTRSTGAGITYPSAANWGETMTVYEFWTRDEYYEYAVGGGFDDAPIVKSGPHPYDMCPFAFAYAQKINSPEPLYAAEPALEGVFRLKPLVDSWYSHMLVIGQQVALPFYYWKNLGNGQPMLNEKGVAITFDQNTANAEIAPQGYELAKVSSEVNQAFVEAGRDLIQQIKDAAPPTGQAEFTTSTQPWAIRLQQQQQNVYPGRLISGGALAIRTAVRNWAHVHSKSAEDGGFGSTYVYARTEDGKVNKDEVLEIKPEDVRSLKIDVTIGTQSGAERITLEEHGRTLYQAGLITLEQYYEDYLSSDNPDEDVMNLKATKLYEARVEPIIADGAMLKAFGNMFTMTTSGQIVELATGRPVTPAQVLLANGQQPTTPPAPAQGLPAQAPGGQMKPQQGMQPTMPSMGQMAAPGSIPIGAGVGGSP